MLVAITDKYTSNRQALFDSHSSTSLLSQTFSSHVCNLFCPQQHQNVKRCAVTRHSSSATRLKHKLFASVCAAVAAENACRHLGNQLYQPLGGTIGELEATAAGGMLAMELEGGGRGCRDGGGGC